MKLLGFLGLRAKVILAIAVPIALISVFLALYFPARQEAAADRALEARARSLAYVLANLVKPYLDLENAEGIEEEFKSVSSDDDFRYVAVVKPDNTLFARQRRGNVTDADEVRKFSEKFAIEARGKLLHVFVPLHPETDEKRVTGTLVMGFSRDSLMNARRESLQTAVIVAIVILVLGILMAWLISGSIVKPLLSMSQRLNAVADDLLAAARAREASAAEEAAAVEETRRTMDMLLTSAQKIADSASVVLGNAERTLDGNREIAERISQLNRHAEKVAEILATIMQVADRTDLLALNAALEGTKAGEAGKGFTLVAKEMRRLAENVMESVTGIRRLMNDVRDASQMAVQASHDGTDFSEETTRSVREIALVTQQQRKATEQVSRSMDEMTELLNHAMADIKQTTRSATALADIQVKLSAVINPGTRNGAAAPPKTEARKPKKKHRGEARAQK